MSLRSHRSGGRPSRAARFLLVPLLAGFLGTAGPAFSQTGATPSIAPDALVWERIRDDVSAVSFEVFVAQFPDSIYRPEAEARLAAIRKIQATASPRPAPEPAALAPEAPILPGLSLPEGEAEALNDKGPIAAPPEAPAIPQEAAPAEAAPPAEPQAEVAAAAPTEPEPGPDGVPAAAVPAVPEETVAPPAAPSEATPPAEPQAETAAVEPAEPEPQPDGQPEGLAGPALVRAIQTALERTGCDPGSVDGEWGQRTRDAAREFAKESGADVDGAEPSTDLLAAIEATGEETVCEAAAPARTIRKAAPAPSAKSRPKKAVAKAKPKEETATKAKPKEEAVARAKPKEKAQAKAAAPKKKRAVARAKPKVKEKARARKTQRSRKPRSGPAGAAAAAQVVGPGGAPRTQATVDAEQKARIDRLMRLQREPAGSP